MTPVTSSFDSVIAPSNPFATRFVRPGRIDYQFHHDESPSESAGRRRRLVTRLARCRFGLIIGPHGTGKSTLVQSLHDDLTQRFPSIATLQLSAGAGWVHRPDSFRNWLPNTRNRLHNTRHRLRNGRLIRARLADLGFGGLLVVDGIEQVTRWDLARLVLSLRLNRQLLLATCHQPIRGLSVLHRTKMDRRLVASLTHRLVLDQPPELRRLILDKLEGQDWTKLTSVRDLWFSLYDEVEEGRHQAPPTPTTSHSPEA